jgi:hypothetical protein
LFTDTRRVAIPTASIDECHDATLAISGNAYQYFSVSNLASVAAVESNAKAQCISASIVREAATEHGDISVEAIGSSR